MAGVGKRPEMLNLKGVKSGLDRVEVKIAWNSARACSRSIRIGPRNGAARLSQLQGFGHQ